MFCLKIDINRENNNITRVKAIDSRTLLVVMITDYEHNRSIAVKGRDCISMAKIKMNYRPLTEFNMQGGTTF